MDIKAKLRPFYVAKMLYEQTDEDHYLTIPNIPTSLDSAKGSKKPYKSKKGRSRSIRDRPGLLFYQKLLTRFGMKCMICMSQRKEHEPHGEA